MRLFIVHARILNDKWSVGCLGAKVLLNTFSVIYMYIVHVFSKLYGQMLEFPINYSMSLIGLKLCKGLKANIY